MKSSLPAVISKVSTMSDNTIRIQVDCQEMNPDQTTEIFRLKGSLGWFFFHEKPISEIETKDLPEIKMEKWEKSPSQRLRAVFYLLWEKTQSPLPFDPWYRAEMEKIIESYKLKLD